MILRNIYGEGEKQLHLILSERLKKGELFFKHYFKISAKI